MNLGKIKRCVREILTSVDTIRQIKGYEILIDTTTANIETNLNIIINEIAMQAKSKEYFEKLRTLCAKFSDCSNCPLRDYKKEFTAKCKAGFTLNYANFSPDELIDAYYFCKKYWEDMFSD